MPVGGALLELVCDSTTNVLPVPPRHLPGTWPAPATHRLDDFSEHKLYAIVSDISIGAAGGKAGVGVPTTSA